MDCEWFPGGKIFLLSYKKGNDFTKTLCGSSLERFPGILRKAKPKFVFVYGPDIAYLDRFYKEDFRNDFICVNALKMSKELIKSDSHRLCRIEKKLGIKREVKKYKENIFSIWKDWRDEKLKTMIIEYNIQDVDSLYLIVRHCIKKFNLKETDIMRYMLK